MLTGIREKTIVKEGGVIEISSADLPVGSEVEVIILVDEKEMDETEYLLSTDANRRHLEAALKELEQPENFVYINIEDYEENRSAPESI